MFVLHKTCIAACAAIGILGAAPQAAIHDAAAKGDLPAVKAAIAADPTLVDAEKPPNKKTALHYAAQNGRTEVVAFLLDKGADVNRPNIAGETPLHYAVGLEDPAVVNVLLARGANPNAKTTNGTTPLRTATAFARLASVKALLDKGADVHDTLPNGQTLLHMAAWVGLPEAVPLFVSRGVDVNAAAKNGQTPLLIACIAGNAAMAATLLDRKADPNTRDAFGWTPLEAAVRIGQPAIVKRLLQAGAKPSAAATADKRSALHHAAARGWLDITKMLLAAGAGRGARDSKGRTPLDLAVRYGNRRVADVLGGASAAAPASSSSKPAALDPAPKLGQAVVWYLGHMGWAVRTANHFMVFDYDGRSLLPDEPSLANGSIVPKEIEKLPTTVFITHSHLDHYAPGVFEWRKTVKDIAYVAGFKPEGKEGYVFMAPRDTKTLGGLDITTTRANDEGVGFFVQVDGVTIFHSGDHSAGNGAPGSFELEIDFLAGRGLRADIVFMPISATSDAAMNQGVHYAAKQLSAAAVFPGHVGGREDVCVEFARDAVTAGMTSSIHCPEFGGDHFTVVARPGPSSLAAPTSSPSASLDPATVRRAEALVRPYMAIDVHAHDPFRALERTAGADRR
jgi:ankyrin repeat protein/L-ascorbate metabolism protein UlaG (beta-lactamase superfamily)